VRERAREALRAASERREIRWRRSRL